MRFLRHLPLITLAFACSVLRLVAQPGTPPLTIRQSKDQVHLKWPANALGFALEQTDTLPRGTWQPVVVSTTASGAEFSATVPAGPGSRFFRLHRRLTTISVTSPVSGEQGVAVTRETVVHFSAPLATNSVVTRTNFYAEFGGRRLLSRVELSSDGTQASLFYLEPLPGSARVVAVFDGNGLLDESGSPLDSDGDGVAGGQAIVPFDTLNLTALAGTAVIGTVFASELVPGSDTGTNAVNRPLAGVTITVDGMEQTLRAVTGADGKFTLQPAPPGRFFVHIDGRTVTNLAAGIHYPDKAYYPAVGKAWDAVAGLSNNLAGGTGKIFLPLIAQETLQPVSAQTTTTVTFPASVVVANPALAGVSITVPANSLFADDGMRGGKVGIAPVPPDRLPGPLPPGMDMALVITIQTDGPSNFDRPVPVKFPNLADPKTGQKLPPGAKSALFSFNHDTGRWEMQGPMTVTADGLFLESDPGVGVRQPGWHGTDPRCTSGGGEINDNPPCSPGDFPGGADETNCRILSATLQGRTGYCEQYRFACNQGCEECLNSGDIAAYEACISACTAYFGYCVTSKTCPWPPDYEPDGREAPEALLPGSRNSQTQLQRFPSPGSAVQTLSSSVTTTSQSLRSTGLHYYAIENLARHTIELRGTAGANGVALAEDVILSPETNYRLWILQARTLQVGSADFTTGKSGTRVEAPTVFTWPDFSPDTDGDGLGDDGETVMGTHPTQPDSDNDGIPDGIEVRQGLNPADGIVVGTGISHTVKTPGPALDVWAGDGLVATAEGVAGVSVLNAFDGTGLGILAHVPIPGNAQRIAGAANLLAVAASDAGLVIVNATVPEAAQITHQLSLGTAQAVAVRQTTAYAGFASGAVAAVDMISGFVRDRLLLPKPVWDLALEGDYLYALTDDRLFAVSMANGAFTLAGSTNAPSVAFVGANRRLSVGGGIAYSVHPRGYNTFDLTDPAHPALLTFGNTRLFGWKQIVPNGSGVGLAAVGIGLPDNEPRDVSLYDLRNPRTNNIFVTTFPTPGVARAVAIWNGLAYVADDNAGLQVLNYLPFDANNVAPTITLAPGFSTNGVPENKAVWLAARATDDVQVTRVDLFLDGIKILSDGAFPFEFHFDTPRLTATRRSFRLRARAVDTGGNSTWSAELTMPLLADNEPPIVLQRSPTGGAKMVNSVFAYFNEAIDPATLTATSFTLVSAGADGTFDTSDDVPVAATVSYESERKIASLDLAMPLPTGLYRATLGTTVADAAGNHLAANDVWQFQVADAVFWVSPRDGVWSDRLQWSTGLVPGTNDDVIIDVTPAEVTVAIGTGSTIVKSLFANEKITLTVGSLQAKNGIRIGRDLTLDRATLRDTAITANQGARLVCMGNPGNTLDGISLNGDLDITSFIARVFIRNGLNLLGSVLLGGGGGISFDGDQALATGKVIFTGNGNGYFIVNNRLTLGPAVAVRGSVGSITGGGSLVNQGVISADVNRGSIRIDAAQFTNSGMNECTNGGLLAIASKTWNNTGTINASGGGSLTLSGDWKNEGVINSENASVSLGGTLTVARLGRFNRSGGTVSLAGLLHLSGDTLTLDAATGSWIINGGTIQGGTIIEQDNAKLSCTGIYGNTLDGVTLQGDLGVTGRIYIRNGLNVIGNVLLDVGGNLTFTGDQTFPTGNIVFTGSVGYFILDGATSLTLGPKATLRGQSGAVQGGGKLTNQGVIAADVPRGTITIATTQFENAGQLVATATNSILKVTTKSFTNTGTIQESNGGKVILNP